MFRHVKQRLSCSRNWLTYGKYRDSSLHLNQTHSGNTHEQKLHPHLLDSASRSSHRNMSSLPRRQSYLTAVLIAHINQPHFRPRPIISRLNVFELLQKPHNDIPNLSIDHMLRRTRSRASTKRAEVPKRSSPVPTLRAILVVIRSPVVSVVVDEILLTHDKVAFLDKNWGAAVETSSCWDGSVREGSAWDSCGYGPHAVGCCLSANVMNYQRISADLR